jgi:hypothetical protein
MESGWKVRLDRHDGAVNANGYSDTLVPADPGNVRAVKRGIYSRTGRVLEEAPVSPGLAA